MITGNDFLILLVFYTLCILLSGYALGRNWTIVKEGWDELGIGFFVIYASGSVLWYILMLIVTVGLFGLLKEG